MNGQALLFSGLFSAVILGACATPRQSAQQSKPEVISPMGRLLYADPPTPNRLQLEENLALARARLAEAPDDPARIVWVGRRLGYLWRMNEAVAVYSDGIRRHPDFAPLYRHRGHRYISLRRFDSATADLERAARLIEGKPDEVEADGLPNSRNIPLTTTAFNVWYHLGLARYLQGDDEGALNAYRKTMEFTQGYDDNVVAVADWMYLTLRRMGRKNDADQLLNAVKPDMDIIENHAYYRRCLMYKGLLEPADRLEGVSTDGVDFATLGYGLGRWYLDQGDADNATDVLRRVVECPQWPAFGVIAAEVELARLQGH